MWIKKLFSEIWGGIVGFFVDLKIQARFHFFGILAFISSVVVPMAWLIAIGVQEHPSGYGMSWVSIPVLVVVLIYYIRRFRRNAKHSLTEERAVARANPVKASVSKIIVLELLEGLVRVVGFWAFYFVFKLIDATMADWMAFMLMFVISGTVGAFFTFVDQLAEAGRLHAEQAGGTNP